MTFTDRRIRLALIGITFAGLLFGAYVRLVDRNQVFCQSPDEMSEVMPGIRLHALPIANLGDPPRYNFVQSMFYSQHGLGDVSFYYLASSLLSAIGAPVSEANLYWSGALTNLAFAAAGGIFAGIIGGAMAGWTFALLVLVSPFYVFVSKSGWARLTWTPLLLVLLFLAQRAAMRRRGAWRTLLFCALGGFVALTDGFVILPVVAVMGWYTVDAPGRFRKLVTDRIFMAGCAAIGAGLAVDLSLALMARARGSELTVMAYVLARGQAGSIVPSAHVLAAWAQCIDYYFPFRGAWLLVAFAAILAVREGLRGQAIGVAAAWWLLASFGILRYAAASEAMSAASIPGFLNAYHIAPPSMLLVAWLLGTRLPARRVAGAAIVVVAALMAWQSTVVAFGDPARDAIGSNRLVKHTDMPISACRTVKGAAYYIRSQQQPGGPLPYVFHLSNDVYVGHIGEFYYGLSYGGSAKPDDPNHLLDFGWHQFERPYPPDAFYGPYGVDRFDYYVEFAEERFIEKAPKDFAPAAVSRLKAQGARVVCTITDGGAPIGWVLSFRNEAPIEIDFRDASARWNREFGRAGTLIQQPLAGSSYHFGYQWRTPNTDIRN